VADRVDTLMETVEKTAARPLGHRRLRQSQLDKLRRRHYPVLLTRNTRYPRIDRGAFVNHELTKAPRPLALPP